MSTSVFIRFWKFRNRRRIRSRFSKKILSCLNQFGRRLRTKLWQCRNGLHGSMGYGFKRVESSIPQYFSHITTNTWQIFDPEQADVSALCAKRFRKGSNPFRSFVHPRFRLHLGFAKNINLPPCQLGRKTYIVTTTSNGQRELGILNDYCRHLFGSHIFYGNSYRLCRTQGTRNKSGCIRIPLYDIDFFSMKFPDNRLDTNPFDPYTGTDRVDIGIPGINGNFGSFAWLPDNVSHFKDTFGNFRNLFFEQTGNEVGMGPRQHKLRPSTGGSHVQKKSLDPVSPPKTFARHLLP